MKKYILSFLGWLILFSATAENHHPVALTLTFSQVNPTCFGYTNGTATVLATGGVEPYTYNWDNNQHGATNFGLAVGSHSVTVIDAGGATASGSVVLTQPNLLVADIQSPGFACLGASGNLVASATGGTPPPGGFQFLWNTGATTAILPNVTAGSYLVTVTDAQGCSAVKSATVSAGSDILLVPTRTSPKCNGGTDGKIEVQVYGNYPPFNFVWENGLANQNLINIPAGDYDITITDATGCSKIDHVILYDNPPISLTLVVDDIPCFMFCDGSVAAVVSGGVGDFTYLWSTGATTGIIENLPPGWYSVTVTDGNGCQKSDSAYVYEPPEIVISIISSSGACGGATGTVKVEATGGTPPFTYLWSNGQTGQTLTNVSAGTYYVQVTDAAGCQKDKPITVDLSNGLDVNIQISSAQCPGVANATATAVVNPPGGNLTYQWSIPGAPPVSQLNNLAAGQTISVTVTDNATGCVGSATAQVGAHNQVEVTVTDTDVQCANNPTGTATAVATMGTAPYNYVWTLQNGSTVTGDQISGLTAGAYLLSVTDAVGCTAVGVADIDALSDLDANLNINLVECLGNQVVVSFSDASSDPSSAISSWNWNIVWSSGTSQSTNQNPGNLTFPANETGTAQLTVTSAAGCTDFISKPFSAEDLNNLKVTVNGTNADCAGNATGAASAVVSGGVSPFSFLWNPGGATGQNLTNLPAGNYTVTVSDSKNCKSTASANIEANSDLKADLNFSLVQCLVNGQVLVNFSDNSTSSATISTWKWEINWSNGNNISNVQNPGNISFQPNETGTVKLTVKTAAGCEDIISKPFSIENLNNLAVAVNATDADCNGNPTGAASAIVSGGASPLSFLWNPGGATGQNLTNLPAGNYTVTVSDAKNCKSTASATIESNSDLTADLNFSLVQCLANGQVLVNFLDNSTSSATISTWKWEINWSNGNNISNVQNPGNISFQPDETGTVKLTVTSAAGCEDIISKPFSIEDLNTLAAAVLETDADCFGNPTGSATAISSGGAAPVTYLWNPGGSMAQVLTNLAPGTYTVTVTDAKNCKSSATATIESNEPNISFNVNLPVVSCAGAPVDILVTGDPNYIYEWSPTTGLDISNNGQTVKVTVTGNTTYVLTVKNNGCEKKVDVPVKFSPPFSMEVDWDMDLCKKGHLLTATATVPVNFQWINWDIILTGNQISVNPADSINLTVIATNSDGCTVSEQVIVENRSAEISVSTMPDPACENTDIVISVNNGHPGDVLTYVWTSSDPKLVISPNNAAVVTVTGGTGNFTVKVVATNQFGCKDEMIIPIIFTPGESLDGKIKADLCNGRVVGFENTSNFTGTWNFGDGQTSNLPDPTHTYLAAGTYLVTFQATETCVAFFDTLIVVASTAAVAANFGFDLKDCRDAAVFQFSDSTLHSNPNIQWSWKFLPSGQTSTSQNPTVTFTEAGPGTFILNVIDENGCFDADTASVPYHFITDNFEDKKSFCQPDSVQLNEAFGSNYQYFWTASPADPTLNPNLGNPTVSPTVKTVYTVLVSLGGCQITDTVEVTPSPAATLTVPTAQNVCSDSPVTLSVSGNGTVFEWSTSPTFNPIIATGTSLQVTPVRDGKYYVRTTTGGDCTATGVVLLNNGSLEIDKSGNLDKMICLGMSTVLELKTDALPGDQLTYSWSPDLGNTANPVVNPTQDIQFIGFVVNQFGCGDTAVFKINVVVLAVSATTAKDSLCPGESTILTANPTGGGNYTYSWSPSSSLDDMTSKNPTATPTETTNYMVTVTDALGCSAVATVEVELINVQCAKPFIFVPLAFTPNGDDKNDRFMVRAANVIEKLYFAVYDRWGELMFETENPADLGWDGTYKNRQSNPDAYGWVLKINCIGGAEYFDKGNVTLLK